MAWENHEISAVILAGGKSSRMGQDKALLPRGGQTQLAHCFQLLEQMQFAQLKVSGHYPEFPYLLDEQPSLGPLGGIAAMLAELGSDCRALLVVPVDMPLLTQEDISRLIRDANEQGGYYQDALFPVLLANTPNLHHQLTQLLAQPEAHKRSLRALISQLQAKAILPSQQLRLENANTPDQWRRLTVEN